jgi:hypothetical protein
MARQMPEGPFEPPHQASYNELKAEVERLRAALVEISDAAADTEAKLSDSIALVHRIEAMANQAIK